MWACRRRHDESSFECGLDVGTSYDRRVVRQSDAPGCRSAAIATSSLIGVTIVFMILGLTLINDPTCTGSCDTLAVTFLYAGLPISAVFGVFFGDLVVAWPLDITFWVLIGFGIARLSGRRDRRVLGSILLTILLALAYGLVLSQFVEIAIT